VDVILLVLEAEHMYTSIYYFDHSLPTLLGSMSLD